MKKITTNLMFCILAVFGFNVLVHAQMAPTTKAADPTADASNVISLFSNAYTNEGVDTWITSWSSGTLTEVTIDGSDMKRYTDLTFVGIETTGANLIDATNMEFFHIDLWTPNATQFRVKLVNFGADGAYGGGDDTEHELTFESPAQNEWISYKLPLGDFAGMTARAHVAQLILSAKPDGGATIYVDNIYFSKAAPLGVPTTAAPTPTEDAADVISIFSGAYDNKTVSTFRTDWSSAVYAEVMVDGNPTIKYSNLDFVGIETTGENLIDASEMEYVHFDVWTPNATLYRLKIVDFGADKAFGGDDTEHEIIFENPEQEEWISVKLPFTDFNNLTNRSNLAQYIFSAQPTESAVLYIDNIYFSKEAGIGVKNINALKGSVYPNPATSILNIDLSADSKINQFEFWSLDGKLMMSNAVNQLSLKTNVDISGLISGIYILKVNTENGIGIFRVVVQ